MTWEGTTAVPQFPKVTTGARNGILIETSAYKFLQVGCVCVWITSSRNKFLQVDCVYITMQMASELMQIDCVSQDVWVRNGRLRNVQCVEV